MSPAIHQLATDVRRLRLPLAAGAALLALYVAASAATMGSALFDIGRQRVLQYLASASAGLASLLAVLLVPLLIHGEPLIGTTAFWRTRPLSGRTLLAAKLLFATLLLAIPLFAAGTLSLAVQGASAETSAGVALESAASSLAFLVAVLALAALTGSFAQFALAGLLVLGAQALNGIILAAVLFPGIDSYFAGEDQGIRLDLWILLAGGAVLVFQYSTLRTARSRVLAAAVLAVALAGQWVAMALREPARPPAATARFDARSVRASLVPGSLASGDTLALWAPRESTRDIVGELALSGLPKGVGAQPVFVTARLRQRDGSVERFAGPTSTYLPSRSRESGTGRRDPEIDALRQALGGIRLARPEGEHPRPLSVLLLRAGARAFDRPEGLAGRYSARLTLWAWQPRVAARLPAARGARAATGAGPLVVIDLLRSTGGATVILREPQLDFGLRSSTYVLANAGRKEAVLGDPTRDLLQLSGGLFSLTLPVRYQNLEFRPPPGIGPLDEAWLAGAELLRLENEDLGTLTVPLGVPDLVAR